jgi:hypothetical protein
LIRALRRLGFEGPYNGKRHQFILKDSLRLRIPNPHGSDISADLLAEILRQDGIGWDTWEAL